MSRDHSANCWTCGRPRGFAQLRKSWSIQPSVCIPQPDDPDLRPHEAYPGQLIVSASVWRNGGISHDSHLCDDCIRIALRAIKVEVSRLLGELDADHNKDAEIAELTERLAALQARHHNVVFDHNRMQERLKALLASPDNPEAREIAEWEVKRGPERDR